MNKKIINILVISGIILLLIILFFKPVCLFKHIFKIPCPMCGITRGIKCILKFKIIESFKYNILSIPVFISIILFYIVYTISVVLKKEYIYNYYNYFVLHYKTIVVILIINWVINMIKGVQI